MAGSEHFAHFRTGDWQLVCICLVVLYVARTGLMLKHVIGRILHAFKGYVGYHLGGYQRPLIEA